MENSNIKKCGRRGCNHEATNKGIPRGTQRPPTFYCEEHLKEFNERKNQKIMERRKRVGLKPICQVREEGKNICGQPAVKLSPKDKVSCCQLHYDQKIEKDLKARRDRYKLNKTKKLQQQKAWIIKNKDKRKQYDQKYYSNNKEKVVLRNNLYRAVKWYYNFLIMKSVDPTFRFETFCDQESRRVFVRDMLSVGLFVENEHSLISDEGLRIRKNIDLRIDLGSKVLYIETKSTSATFTEEETKSQVELYKKLLEEEINNGFRKEAPAKFLSWSPSGDNSDLALIDMYSVVKKEISTIYKTFKALYPKRVNAKMKSLFPFLDYQGLLKICDLRIRQLKKVDKYRPESSGFDFESIKYEVVNGLISGKINYPSIDLSLLRKEYGL